MDKIIELTNSLAEVDYGTYERENYDRFLRKSGFSFKIPSIHITGTNGKGSTANYLANIYQVAGYKVGLFHSPYFNKITEMIHINGVQINDEDFLSVYEDNLKLFDKFSLSPFERETYCAFKLFEKEHVDLAIIEVGMGGDIDATNVFTPILSIITKVELEHTNFLGKSISEIAESKSGIIKQYVPTLIGANLEDAALEVIKDKCRYEKSNLFVADELYNVEFEGKGITFSYKPFAKIFLNTLAKYQANNASIAIEATKILNDKFPVKEEGVLKGLELPLLPGRYEFIADNVLVDGAHNPDAIFSLVESIRHLGKPIHVLFASFRDKNIGVMLPQIAKFTEDVTITTFPHKRARTEEDYFLYLEEYKFVNDPIAALNDLRTNYKDDIILVCGSLAFAGYIRGQVK